MNGLRSGGNRGAAFSSWLWEQFLFPVLGRLSDGRRALIYGSWRPVARLAQRAQPQTLDGSLLRGPAGAAEAGAAGADAGARRILQLRGARGAQPRGAGECGASVLPAARRSLEPLGRAEEGPEKLGAGGGWETREGETQEAEWGTGGAEFQTEEMAERSRYIVIPNSCAY